MLKEHRFLNGLYVMWSSMKITLFERLQNRNVVNEVDLCIYNYVPVFHLMEVIKIVADRSR